jgi:hypothetical protein
MRVLLLFCLPAAAWAHEVIGVARCRGCHPAAYTQWRSTAHARAATTLTPAQRVDPRCTSCHSTDAARGHLHVQCESCHGPGGGYWPERIMRDPAAAREQGLQQPDAERMCRRCHGGHALTAQRFDFPRALLHIRHGRSKGL